MPGDRLPDGPDVIMQSDSRGHPNYYLDTDDIDASTAKATRTTGRSLGAVADDGRLVIGADATAVITLRHYLE